MSEITIVNNVEAAGWITIYSDGIWPNVPKIDWGPIAAAPAVRQFGSLLNGSAVYCSVQMDIDGNNYEAHCRYTVGDKYAVIDRNADGNLYFRIVFGDPGLVISASGAKLVTAPKVGVYMIRSKKLDAFLTPAKHFVSHGAPVNGLHQLIPPTLQEWVLDEPGLKGSYTLSPVAKSLAGTSVVTAAEAVFVNKGNPTHLDIHKIGDKGYIIRVAGPVIVPQIFSLASEGAQVKIVGSVIPDAFWSFEFIRPLVEEEQ